MVCTKRHVPPPQRPTNKAPRLASWQNQARSCFAVNPTRAVTRPTYIHWSEDPNHVSLLTLPNIAIVAGALPPYSSTAFHSHHYNTFVLSIIDSPGFTMQNLLPPEYTQRSPQNIASLSRGACFSQCPFSSKLPFVHRGVTAEHRVAFLMIESSVPSLPQSAPMFVASEKSDITIENRAPSNFWAAAELNLGPGAEAIFDPRSSTCPLPLARFICRLERPLDSLQIRTPSHLQRQTVQRNLVGTLIQTIAISGFKNCSDTCLQIDNTGQEAWSGFIVDIFGTASL